VLPVEGNQEILVGDNREILAGDNREILAVDNRENLAVDNQGLLVEDIQVQVGNLELRTDILVLVGNLEIVLEPVDILGWEDNQWMKDTVVRYLVFESQYRAAVVVDRTDWDTFVRRWVYSSGSTSFN
jgi:hypothetical protein